MVGGVLWGSEVAWLKSRGRPADRWRCLSVPSWNKWAITEVKISCDETSIFNRAAKEWCSVGTEKKQLLWTAEKMSPKQKFRFSRNNERKELSSPVWWSIGQFIPPAQPWQKHTSENIRPSTFCHKYLSIWSHLKVCILCIYNDIKCHILESKTFFLRCFNDFAFCNFQAHDKILCNIF